MDNISDFNLYLFNEGKLEKGYEIFGAHLVKENNIVIGTMFRVYAPNARIVSVIGDFNNWDSRVHTMNKVSDMGIYELFIKECKEWDKYRYVILTKDNETLYKSDPYAFFSDFRPETCSKVYDIDGYNWSDREYLEKRKVSNIKEEPLNIYEMNIGSWMRKPDNSFNKYNEIKPLLIPYLKMMGFNAVEFMPLMEFPLDESWGYQGTGYYSMTSRYGVPKDLMYLIDELHKANIKVIFDFVPGHISKDPHGLYKFDGSFLYEYDDSFKRENVEWGTANLDFSKGTTRSFLLSAAHFYINYFHIDGLRIDAVSNIYYFLGNQNNGTNNDGVNFLKQLSSSIKSIDNNIILSAEDSTIFPNVTKKVEEGGVGFDFKWNMGWMNDTLKYFKLDPIYRKYHHNYITFSLVYAFSENFILPLSHDEVVHLKGSLIDKMPGDYFLKFAGFRALLGFMYTHPGKKLLFMGGEFAQFREWRDTSELDWFLLQYEKHKKAQTFVKDLSHLYLNSEVLYKTDDKSDSFRWIDSMNENQSIFIYRRKYNNEYYLMVLNLTPNTYLDYRVGVEYEGLYTEIINSDKEEYGGSNLYNGLPVHSERIPMHSLDNSINIVVSPMSISIFKGDINERN